MKHSVSFLAVLVVLMAAVPAAQGQLRYGKLGIGVTGSMFLPSIDNVPTTGPTGATPGIGGGLTALYSPWENIGLKTIVGVGQFSYKFAGSPSTTTMLTLNGYGTINFMPNSSFNPFLGVGAGYHYTDARTDVGGNALVTSGTRTDISMLATGGFDIFFDEFFSVTASADFAIMRTDWIDGLRSGGNDDSYIRAGLELRYYFFDQAFLSRLLEALKARYER